MPLLLILFIGVPLAEIAVFIQVGEEIGLWPTLAAIVVTALVGSALLRYQGLATLAKAQSQLQRDEFPAGALLDGVCLVFAGALLLTPGFITDTVGFLLFVPGVRQAIGRFLLKNVTVRMRTAHGRAGGYPGGPTVVDGEYEDVTDTGADTDRPRDRGDGDPRTPPLPPAS